MLMNNGPWSPEHIYQEIAGYTATRHRGKSFVVGPILVIYPNDFINSAFVLLLLQKIKPRSMFYF